MFQDLTSLVVNVGTCSTKIGYGGDDAPKIITPSFVGKCCSDMIPEIGEDRGKLLTGQKYMSLNRPDLEIESVFAHHSESKLEIDLNKY